MFPPQQWDKLHLKAWSWLKDELLQGYVKFYVGCVTLRNMGTKLKQLWESNCRIFWVKTISRYSKTIPKKLFVDKCNMCWNANLK